MFQNIAANTSGSPGEILPVKCDLRQKDDIEKMFHTIKDHWGGVDVCINNAGLALGPSIIEGDSDEWDNMWQVLIDFSLTVRAATLIFISIRSSASSSAKEGKSGFIYNLVKS